MFPAWFRRDPFTTGHIYAIFLRGQNRNSLIRAPASFPRVPESKHVRAPTPKKEEPTATNSKNQFTEPGDSFTTGHIYAICPRGCKNKNHRASPRRCKFGAGALCREDLGASAASPAAAGALPQPPRGPRGPRAPRGPRSAGGRADGHAADGHAADDAAEGTRGTSCSCSKLCFCSWNRSVHV